MHSYIYAPPQAFVPYPRCSYKCQTHPHTHTHTHTHKNMQSYISAPPQAFVPYPVSVCVCVCASRGLCAQSTMLIRVSDNYMHSHICAPLQAFVPYPRCSYKCHTHTQTHTQPHPYNYMHSCICAPLQAFVPYPVSVCVCVCLCVCVCAGGFSCQQRPSATCGRELLGGGCFAIALVESSCWTYHGWHGKCQQHRIPCGSGGGAVARAG
jgi:hypothetical protein